MAYWWENDPGTRTPQQLGAIANHLTVDLLTASADDREAILNEATRDLSALETVHVIGQTTLLTAGMFDALQGRSEPAVRDTVRVLLQQLGDSL